MKALGRRSRRSDMGQNPVSVISSCVCPPPFPSCSAFTSVSTATDCETTHASLHRLTFLLRNHTHTHTVQIIWCLSCCVDFELKPAVGVTSSWRSRTFFYLFMYLFFFLQCPVSALLSALQKMAVI